MSDVPIDDEPIISGRCTQSDKDRAGREAERIHEASVHGA
jgi:hypothetical protein